MDAVERHLREHTPWGAQLEIEVEPASSPLALSADASAARALETAYGKPVAVMGSGGSIPLVARLAEVYPDAEIVLWGAQDSDAAQIHAANESVDLEELEKIALTEALLLTQLARVTSALPPKFARKRRPERRRELDRRLVGAAGAELELARREGALADDGAHGHGARDSPRRPTPAAR